MSDIPNPSRAELGFARNIVGMLAPGYCTRLETHGLRQVLYFRNKNTLSPRTQPCPHKHCLPKPIRDGRSEDTSRPSLTHWDALPAQNQPHSNGLVAYPCPSPRLAQPISTADNH